MLGFDAGLRVSGVGPDPRFGIDDHLFWMSQKDALQTAAGGAGEGEGEAETHSETAVAGAARVGVE